MNDFTYSKRTLFRMSV